MGHLAGEGRRTVRAGQILRGARNLSMGSDPGACVPSCERPARQCVRREAPQSSVSVTLSHNDLSSCEQCSRSLSDTNMGELKSGMLLKDVPIVASLGGGLNLIKD